MTNCWKGWVSQSPNITLVEDTLGGWVQTCFDFALSCIRQQLFRHVVWNRWRVSQNTQSVIKREVRQAIVDEYLPKMMNCPTIPRTGIKYRQVFPEMDLSTCLPSVKVKTLVCSSHSLVFFYLLFYNHSF